MSRGRRAGLVFLCAGLVVAAIADTADARGGRGGRARARLGGALVRPASDPPAATVTPQAVTTRGRLTPAALSAINSTSALPPPPQTTPQQTPASAIAAPQTPVPAIAPLSQQITPQTLTAGGAARTDSASPSSSSPTEAAPSIAGGGGKSLADCLGFWEPATHMSKSEWRAACQRSQNRLNAAVVDQPSSANSKR